LNTGESIPAGVGPLLEQCTENNIRFLRLQFTDVLGSNKNVEVPAGQIRKALQGEILFDGSSIEGFVRIEESDTLLRPDLATFRILPWEDGRGRIARVICDVTLPDGSPFSGCPRTALRQVVDTASSQGFTPVLGPEIEFFLFHRNNDGSPSTDTQDTGGYFDLTPMHRGEECRGRIVNAMEEMGYPVEAAHHEVAPGQHEIDFRRAEAVQIADTIATFRLVARKIALEYNLHATFMPKPLDGRNGSGMHLHQSLFRDGANAFHDPEKPLELSDTALQYIAGLLAHARGMCAVTNPLVNSYKRLVPGFEAPTNIVWSEHNVSPLARIPARRGHSTRVELRMPDPSCNPYLAVAAMISAGLDGIENGRDPGEPVNKDVFKLSFRERRRLRIDELPHDLREAVKELKKDGTISAALGKNILGRLVDAQQAAWQEYTGTVHTWELDRYLGRY
jgi:glutamine synthetase